MHLNTAYGQYQGWTTGYQFNELLNSSHIYDTCYVNNTTLYVDYGYNWKTYSGPTPPYIPVKNKFNWVLFKKKNKVIKRKL